MTKRSSSHTATPCLSDDDLRHYVLGSMDDQHASQLEQHLVECPHCEQLLVALEDHSDAFIQALSILPASDDDEDDYRRLREEALKTPIEIADPERVKELFRHTSRLRDPVEAPLPFQLGNYQLLQRIGRGASGAVYRARHSRLNKTVAVKVLDPACADALESFIQEMETIGSLTHPHVVRATDAGEANGLHYLVMEFIEGADAGRLLYHHEKLPVADACEIVRQAAIGLQFLHDRALIHRDIKPSNLLVTATGQIKLLDLGIATRSGDPQVADSGHPTLIKPQGTLAYMAPEQVANPSQVGTKSDLYSLGCTLFKLLTGTAPSQPVPPLTDFRTDVPRSVDRLLRRLLAQQKDDRPESPREVIESLQSPARNANLRLLVAPLCPEGALATQTESLAADHWAKGIVNRRTVLAALGAAGVSVALWPWLRSRGPALETARWRSLKPVSANVLLSLGKPENTSLDVSDKNIIKVVSDDLTLIQLGRPVVGKFALRVRLRPNGKHSCGVFFQGQQKSLDESSAFLFQTVELELDQPKPKGSETASCPSRLTWNLWTARQRNEKLTATRTPLSEIAVNLNTDAPAQHLMLTLGRQGMPEITFNGDKLHETMWRFSQEARKLQRLSPTQLPTAFLGKLGLISSKGSHTFERPQLTYLEDTHDA